MVKFLHARTNLEDPYAVAVVTSGTTVGHVPRAISAVCHFFLRKSGTIHCQVTGSRWYSSDLPQGGLEIPCILTFSGKEKDINKVKKLLKNAPSVVNNNIIEPPNKKIKLVTTTEENEDSGEKKSMKDSSSNAVTSIWL